MHTNTHTSPELETVIDTWALMELGQVRWCGV